MSDPLGAAAYAEADFSVVNQKFVDRVLSVFGEEAAGRVLDLGCGPADIPIRIAKLVPESSIVAVDASPTMLKISERAVAEAGLQDRILLVEGRLPVLDLAGDFELIVSNSLVHHLPDPLVFWGMLKDWSSSGTGLLVRDLIRPDDEDEAQRLVELYSGTNDPRVHRDFLNSLLASFSVEEVQGQLEEIGLSYLRAERVSDRHWTVEGALLW